MNQDEVKIELDMLLFRGENRLVDPDNFSLILEAIISGFEVFYDESNFIYNSRACGQGWGDGRGVGFGSLLETGLGSESGCGYGTGSSIGKGLWIVSGITI